MSVSIETFIPRRNRKLNLLINHAKENDVQSIVKLLKQPAYASLLELGTPNLCNEIRDRSVMSYNSSLCDPASLLSVLCAKMTDPHSPIPTWLPLLIRLMVAALPTVLYPPSSRESWVHPINFLRRGDPLFGQCRDAMLIDVHWSSELHALLPVDVQAKHVLLARILWKYGVLGMDHVFKMICSYLPPIFESSTSSKFVFRTVHEIAHGLGVHITQELWKDVSRANVHILYEANDITNYFDDFVMQVPEMRSSGNAIGTCAFPNDQVESITNDIKNKTTDIRNLWGLKALGLPSPCKVAMTTGQHRLLMSIDPDNSERTATDGIFKHWLENEENDFDHNNLLNYGYLQAPSLVRLAHTAAR